MDWICIARKEIWEFKNIKNKKIFLLLFLFITLFYGFSGGHHSVIPNEYSIYYLAFIISISFGSQLTIDVISLEKEQNTLEILKVMNISKKAIILGKVMPSFALGTLFSYVAIFIVKICFMINNINLNIELIGLIFILFMNCITTMIIVTTAIIVDDKKLMPILSVINPVGFILVLLYLYSFFANYISYLHIALFLIFLSILIFNFSVKCLGKFYYRIINE